MTAQQAAAVRLAKAMKWSFRGHLVARYVAGMMAAADDAEDVSERDIEGARALLRDLGAVFPDPELVARVMEAEKDRAHHARSLRDGHKGRGVACDVDCPVCGHASATGALEDARLALAEDVMGQVGGDK